MSNLSFGHAIVIDSVPKNGAALRVAPRQIELRFNVRNSPNLPPLVGVRLEKLAGRRLTKAGVVVINAQRHRTQERNRADALERLLALIRKAAVPLPPPRRSTRRLS